MTVTRSQPNVHVVAEGRQGRVGGPTEVPRHATTLAGEDLPSPLRGRDEFLASHCLHRGVTAERERVARIPTNPLLQPTPTRPPPRFHTSSQSAPARERLPSPIAMGEGSGVRDRAR